MPVSAGIDVVDVAEVETALRRFGRRYLRRLFTPGEVAACPATGRAAYFATCFAAKEAALKALAMSGEAAAWCSIEVGRAASGEPTLSFSGRIAEFAVRDGVRRTALGISTTRRYAAAVVIIERECTNAPAVVV